MSLCSGGAESRKGDRHKDKGDRHKAKGDRHKDKVNRNLQNRHEVPKDHGHACICGYSMCSDVRKKFNGTNHAFDRRPIEFRVPKQNTLNTKKKWGEFFDSMMRNLHVPEDIEDKIRASGEGSRFDVCAHHFTEEAVAQYWSNPRVQNCYFKRFDRCTARMILHLPLDKRDTDDEGNYFLNANNPMEDVLAIANALKSARGSRASSRLSSDDDAEKQAMRTTISKKNSVIKEKHEELQKMAAEIERLKEENKRLKQLASRRKKRADTAVSENKQLREEMDDSYTLEDITDILVKIGGMSRATLYSRSFHEKYPGAAKCLWGFESYDETLTMVECLFPDVDVNDVPALRSPKKRKSTDDTKLTMPTQLKPLERCLICKLFFRRTQNQELISLIMGNHRTTIGKVLKEWAPRWGKAGEQLSILDITKEYLDGEEPDRSAIVGVTKTVSVDGTDTKVEKNRKDPTAAALEYGSKNKERGARSLNYCTATCLSFEHTKLFCARASEKAIYELHGSLGKKTAPLTEWKGIAKSFVRQEDKICRLKVSTENMFDYHDIEAEIDTIKALKLDNDLAEGAVDDGVLLTATPAEVDQMPGVKPKQSSSTSNSRLPPTTTKSRIPTMKDIDDWFDLRDAARIVAEKSDKLSPFLTADILEQCNKSALKDGVNSSGKEKLAQYEVHERLHRAYQSKKLRKTILAYFVLATENDRHKALKWMGSDLAPPDMPMPKENELPIIWERLAKIPPEYSILGDKGFYKTDRFNPNLNCVRTPWKLSDERVQGYKRSAGMVADDRETSDTRVVVEDDYERYRNEDILKGAVPFWLLALLPYAHEWGHANMNLLDPVRKPGSNSVVSGLADYWDKHKK